MNQIALKQSEYIMPQSLWMMNGSILANYMGGRFPVKWLDDYSKLLGNTSEHLHFWQIADYFTATKSESHGIYTALFLSDYMGNSELFAKISFDINQLAALKLNTSLSPFSFSTQQLGVQASRAC